MKWLIRIAVLLIVGLLLAYAFLYFAQRDHNSSQATYSLSHFEQAGATNAYAVLPKLEQRVSHIRVVEGNAAPLILELCQRFEDPSDEVSEFDPQGLERAGAMTACRFYPDVFPIEGDFLQVDLIPFHGFQGWLKAALGSAQERHEAGDLEGAERIYASLVSLGHHLTQTYSSIALFVGVNILQKTVPEWNQLHASLDAANLETTQVTETELEALKAQIDLMVQHSRGLFLSEEGHQVLKRIFENEGVPPAIRVLAMQEGTIAHFFNYSSVILGPGREQRAALDWLLDSQDPQFVAIAALAQPILSMSFLERWNAVDQASVAVSTKR